MLESREMDEVFVMSCRACRAQGKDDIIEFAPEDTEVRCVTCRRHYRVVSRHIVEPTRQLRLKSGMVRYTIFGSGGGRVKLHRFVGPSGLKLLVGKDVTIVYHGRRLVGVAHQSDDYFEPIATAREARPYRFAWLAICTSAALLSVLQTLRAGRQFFDVFRDLPLQATAITLVVVTVVAVPFIMWLMKPVREQV